MDINTIKDAVRASFIGELEAFKPGNVSVYSDGHDMTVKDFIDSADASIPELCKMGATVGERILESVKQTRSAVGCNTNLGMLLLFAPIIVAAEEGFSDSNVLQQGLKHVLASLSQDDAVQVYEAIRLANPGGLGRVESQDVAELPACSLIDAMQLASHRDFVALQYTNNFDHVFSQGLSNIKCFVKRWNSVKWATVSCYLMFLCSMNDSHIERKYGSQVAEKIRIKSEDITNSFTLSDSPESQIDLLRKFDQELKSNNINPGTCADLTSASLLVYNLNC